MKVSFANKCLNSSLALVFALSVILAGCGADQIVAGLQTADLVAQSAIGILLPTNPEIASIMSAVDLDLKVVVKAYQDYDNALPANKAAAADLIKATVGTIQTNLAAILQAVGVKNPGLLRDINIAVAVVNSAVLIVLSKVSGTTAQTLMVSGPSLPIVPGAKSAKDLKNYWNGNIQADFPKAKI